MSADMPRDIPREGPRKRSLTRFLPAIARILMGAAFVVFGLNLFLGFIPPPEGPLPEGATAFVGALEEAGYMMPLIGGTQLVVGVLLLVSRFVPLALALIAPFIVHSVAFHLFLEPAGLPMALVFLALELYLAWTYRAAYRSMLAGRVDPS